MSDDGLQLILAPLATLVGFFLSIVATAAETSLLTVDAQRRRSAGFLDSDLIDGLLEEEDRLVLSLRGFDLCAKLLATVAAAILGSRLAEFYLSPFAGDYSFVGYAIGGFIALITAIIVVEIVPQSLPAESAPTVALFLAPFAWMITRLMKPFVWPHLWLSRRLLSSDNGEDKMELEISEIELQTALSLGEIEGVIEEDTRDIIEGIFSFGDQVAGEIMTPRGELFTVSKDELSGADLGERLRQSGYTRAVVHDGGLDSIVGVIDRRSVLLDPEASPETLIRKPLFVPAQENLIDLLADMKRSRIHFAVVLDEYGGTTGVVTMEDLLNEIVGELEDDAMRGAEIRQVGATKWIVSGRLDVERLNDRLNLELPEDVAQTVSGLILAKFGQLPSVGDVVEIDSSKLTVTRLGARRVAQVRLETTPPEDNDVKGGGE